MVTISNRCESTDPHEPHSWKGAINRYHCSGIELPKRMNFEFVADPVSPAVLDLMLKVLPEQFSDDETVQHIRVVTHEFWKYFLEAYAEYGSRAADELGLAGQWGDLHRKVKKLKAPLWSGDSNRLTRETPRQVLFDIIGHALLAVDMLDRGMQGGR